MAPLDALAYCVVLAGLTISPGPLTAILVARTFADDRPGAYAFSFGIALGDTLIILLICLGLGVWIQSFPAIFSISKGFALVFIMWIAFQMLNRKSTYLEPSEVSSSTLVSSVFAGMLMCAVSPQTLLLYLFLLPRVIDLSDFSLTSLIGLLFATYLTLTLSLFTIVYFADKIRPWILSNVVSPVMDRVLAGTVALSGVLIIF